MPEAGLSSAPPDTITSYHILQVPRLMAQVCHSSGLAAARLPLRSASRRMHSRGAATKTVRQRQAALKTALVSDGAIPAVTSVALDCAWGA